MATTDVSIIDVSMRDGIQNEAAFVPFNLRLEVIAKLIRSGVKSLQIASFVNPKRVPQMAGIESLVERLPVVNGVEYSGLVLNAKGLDRLISSGLKHVDLSLSCSDAHSLKNAGITTTAALAQAVGMIGTAKAAGLSVRVGLQCAFGCNFSGAIPTSRVVAMARDLAAAGCDALALADSTGQAVPAEVTAMIHAVRTVCSLPLILHLHDTRGLGMANLLAGFQAGVRHFDASLGGVGGCNFIPGATGNIAIEDVLYLFDRMEVSTGIALTELLPAARVLEQALGVPLPGRVHQLAKKMGGATGPRSSEVASWV